MKSDLKILLFDGNCILCNNAIYFLHKRLRYRNYKFVPSQSEEGTIIIEKYKLGNLPEETIVLIKDNEVFIKSNALFEILDDMPYKWSVFKIFKIFPVKLNDYIYEIISKNRHIIFGKVKRKYE